ncbi:S-methyl-5'-thioadenosine phosphorylase [Candidatus Poribacteria bacterium]|nr:S-methyl-5'-thioadenosine phosphorylase [Candidatus Poribacteria bacterium]
MATARVAVIGGSGFYQMDGLSDIEERAVETPFGSPSDSVVLGTLDGERVAFLPRHGRGHRISPTHLNVRANIYALKTLGVDTLLSFSAVGSLREHIEPTSFVVPDQLFDHTKSRSSSFFGQGIVAHVGMAEPYCPCLRDTLIAAGHAEGSTVHDGGQYICIEGPQFSTVGESKTYRQWGMDIIGMTAATEAKLAREAEMCYATLAAVTDFDVWHPDHATVTTEMILANLSKNVENGKRIVRDAIRRVTPLRDCSCRSALASAIATNPDVVPGDVRERLGLFVGKYLR